MTTSIAFVFAVCSIATCVLAATPTSHPSETGYAPINGLRMYYEIHGPGDTSRPPLILLHGGGSTITTSFGRILPSLSATRRVIAVELQAHGHTADIDRPLSAEQDADDVAALLDYLHIGKADFMGFSNGGTDCLQIAIRHPKLVDKLVLLSAPWKRDSFPPGFFEMFQNASLEKMLPPELKEAYLQANPDPKGIQAMFEKDVARMLAFKDIADADIKAVAAPALVVNGDAEVIRVESSLALSRTLPHGQLAVFPGGHGHYIGEISAPDKNSRVPELVAGMIDEFLGR